MNTRDAARFGELCKKVQLSLDCKPPSKDRLDKLFEKLKHHSIGEVEAAFDYWLEVGRRFPYIADMKDALLKTRRPPSVDQSPVVDHEIPHCYGCGDDGWQTFWCPGDVDKPTPDPFIYKREQEHCGRRYDHAGHEYVKRCPCYHTNPVVRARRMVGV